jgi:acyl carrier protein
MNEIEITVVEILGNLGVENIDDFSAKLIEDLGLDSLKMVTLLIEIEDAFSIELDESDMNPFDLVTVKDIVTLATKYVAEDGGGSNG